VDFNGSLGKRWNSPVAAARAISKHQSGIADWDDGRSDAPVDLLDWTPLGDDL
jgi:hypothetical protein